MMCLRLGATIFTLVAACWAAPRSVVGTWCVQDQDLVLTFKKGDTLLAAGEAESGISGSGRYTMGDSTFTATVSNGEVTVELGYRYRWESDSVISAQAISLTVNKEPADLPKEWMRMKRCAKKVVSSAAPASNAPSATPASSEKKKH